MGRARTRTVSALGFVVLRRPTSLLVFAALAMAGCAAAPKPAAPATFSAQACVERSLRRTADPSMLPLAFSEFTKACEQGEQSACSSLGVMYEMGLGTTEDHPRAFALYQAACEAQNIGACTNLGLAFLRGVGTTSDPRRAKELLEWSCGHDHPVACRELGSLHFLGEGVVANPEEASKYYRLGCKKADGESCYDIGALYEQGNSLPQDNAQALSFFEQACVQGEPRGCDGVDRIHKASEEALRLRGEAKPMASEVACDAGQATECAVAGLAYFRGDLVKRDVERAATLLQRACKGGDTTSCSVLGPMLQGSCAHGNAESCAALQKLQVAPAATAATGEE